VVDAEVERLERYQPMPDTGSLRGDLLAYARQAAASIGGQEGLTFLRAVVSTVDDGETGAGRRFLVRRAEQIQAMLDRAVARGEPQRRFSDVVDGILAPLYLRRLLGLDGVDEDYLESLADRVVAWDTPR
jgi:tetracycline repressor-like protein